MRAVLYSVAAGIPMATWESHGEMMDVQELQASVFDDDAIERHNRNPVATWVAARNPRFEGHTLADAKKLMGALQHTDKAAWLPHKPVEQNVDLPTEFDWRTDPRAAECPSLKEIRDQASCGSCWAFGSVEAMTDRICIASKGADKSHLSAEDVTSCCHLGDNGCGGGIPSTVYQYYRSSGIVTGGNYGDKSMCYSYQLAPCAHHVNSTHYKPCQEGPTPTCARKCIDNGADWSQDKRHGAEGGYSVCKQGESCEQAMMQEIYQNGPITGMFFVHQSLLSYKSGVYSAGWFWKDPMLGGHAIKIMGFGTENGTPYWLIANSWNTEWGDNGYFKIKRGDDNCQIENAMINGGPVAGMPGTKAESLVV
jgi:cathepsin B